MKHSNISIFVPHIGCPHRCSFCDQNTISGAQHLPDGEEVRTICEKALREARSPADTEIAFFGGSFTAIPRDYMLELLSAASEFVGEGRFRGIRCSTRPDCISHEILELLKSYGVTAIELGAQSMDDEVLRANERGHSAQDVRDAAALIKEHGIELGLQMMTGLWLSTPEKDMKTAEEIIALRPETVRIYPVVVLENTVLAELYKSGEYRMTPFEDMTQLCADMMLRFTEAGIRVIKCGLHASEFVERDMVAGYYHPAYREICESLIYRRVIGEQLREKGITSGSVTVAVNDRCISKAAGQNRSNTVYFGEQGISIRITGDSSIPVYGCTIKG